MIPILIIVDPRYPENNIYLEAEMKRQGINEYAFVPAVIFGHDTVEGCIGASHKKCVQLAKDEGWPEVCVMEDDVWFPAEDGWNYFLRKKPIDYDIYLAGTYDVMGTYDNTFYDIDDGTAARVRTPTGFHCYFMNERYYDRLLATPDNVHIDTYQHEGVFVVCFPFAALQRRSRSAVHRSEQDYNHELRERRRNWVHGFD
jgi:hypothetical protein